MTTECSAEQVCLGGWGEGVRREVRVDFAGGQLSSDGGVVLVAELERRQGIVRRFAACFVDYRDPAWTEHEVGTLVAQRVLGLVLGYEDLNDHEQLRGDPLLAAAVGLGDPTGGARRVVGKAEVLGKGPNPRFVVTSLPTEPWPAVTLYEQLYCQRGEMENRIKEQQLEMFADRTSSHWMAVNQLRLWFASVAYVLLAELRRLGLAGTALARAQCGTIRLKMLKIGARVRVTARRLWISLSSAYPDAALWRAILLRLQALPPPTPA